MNRRRLAGLVLVGGIVGIVLGLSKYHAAVIGGGYDFTGSGRFAWSFALMALLALSSYAVGLPDAPRTARGALATGLGAGVLGAVGMSTVQFFTGDALLPRFVVFGSALLLVPLGLLAWWVSGASARDPGGDLVVLVAESDEERLLVDDLVAGRFERAARLTLTLRPADVTPGHLRERFAAVGGTVLVLSRTAQLDERVVVEAGDLHEHGVRVRTLAQFYEEWLGKLPVGELERMSLMFDIGEVHATMYGRLKRLMDLALALVGAVPLVLVTPFVFLANLAGNRGPLFYRQTRVGKNDRQFDIVKLRTMRPSTGPTEWTASNDPRITPFGGFLRKTHLDELPQVWNVLKGDLSIVGPRPEQPRYVAELSEKLPFYHLRHLVQPGITGWAQVKYPYGASEQDALEKLQYEFFYLRHQSLRLDARIVLRTLRSVVRSGGR
jgi:lipopolysaccharide/colanic/teichoic acid biosynthesis glycosyltransferase